MNNGATETITSLKALNALRKRLIAEADTAHAGLSQYQGHYKGWVVARARRDIKLEGKVIAAREGEYLLMKPFPSINENKQLVRTGYANGYDFEVLGDWLQEVVG